MSNIPETVSRDLNAEFSAFSQTPISSLLQRISTFFSSQVASSLAPLRPDQGESDIVAVDTKSQEDSDSYEEDEGVLAASFFEDDGVAVPASPEDLPAPLGGGILLEQTYAVSAKKLNAFLFKPGTPFLQDLAHVQKTTDLVETPWRKREGGLPWRIITYVKAPTRIVKSVKATEDQAYVRADEKGFVVNVVASTPDAPYGNTFRADLQYCIFAGAYLPTGDKTSRLRISWGIRFLSNPLIKVLIESGARQGLQESFKQFAEVLERYAKVHQGSQPTTPDTELRQEVAAQGAGVDQGPPKNEWQLAKEYFCNLRVCITITFLLAVLLHIYLSRPCPKGGLEFWIFDLPNTVSELLTSAALGILVEHVLQMTRKFLRARVCRGSDHGVKAKGNGWLLSITLVGARNLPASKEAGVPDPYVVFTCSGKARTSSVKLQTSNPDWEERFEFDATEEAPSTLEVEAFDFDGPFTEAESVGHAEINFLKQTQEELADLWVPLKGKDACVSGSKLHLRIALINTRETDNMARYIEKVEKEVGRKIARSSLQKNASFQRLFSLPAEEFLVNDFSCSLKRKLLLQGRLFLSQRVLAFYSNIFGHKTKFTLLWENIDEIKETSPALGSVGMLLNPTILVFTKKGRAMDAQHGAKSMDAKGRFKFQFQSFIRFKTAYRTMMALWKYRTLTPEQQMEILADMERGGDVCAMTQKQTDESETFLGVDEAKLTKVYSTDLPLSVDSMMLIYVKENLDEKIAEKTGHLNYSTTPWEPIAGDAVQQRCIMYKLSNRIALFGTNVTCIQQKTKQEDGQALFIDEVLTLHEVPFGDYFQIRVREELENIPSTPAACSCRIFVGVAWHKSTIFQSRISKNIFERYTKYLKDCIDIAVKEILENKDENTEFEGHTSPSSS